jgi:two-component system LytT family sensor kinase
MPDRLSIHEPVLVNTIGHCAGAIIFGILLYLFVVNWRHAREERTSLPAVAAALAMLWNIGSLIAIATGPNSGIIADVIVAGSFSVLSVLPAVLLHISLEADRPALWISGYFLSAIAVTLHISDLLTQAPRFHYAALLLVTLGFGGLTIISVILEVRQKDGAAGSRLAGAMGLFLFAISFVHFGASHPRQVWSGEIALHHAGLPLALLVLLQDYRFLLLDTFLRFILNASLAAGALLIGVRAVQSQNFAAYLRNPFEAGLIFVSASLLLVGFVYVRNRMQHGLTRVVFLRSNVDQPLRQLNELGRVATTETEYLRNTTKVVAEFLHATRFSLAEESPLLADLAGPIAVMDSKNWGLPAWVQAAVPLRLSHGDTKYLLLGSRKGGRRYLSEDCTLLARLGAALVEHVEQLRSAQMQSLMSQAELRALQAQINPHFLFNSFNTLYGTIGRENAEARRLVLNLADVFRYFLQSDRTFIPVEEELRIVRAYLEIEELRLGPRLRTEIEVDDTALKVSIPALSIQPLVENAVKHGVAARMGDGLVRLAIRAEQNQIAVSISNSGECDSEILTGSTTGVGLANVRRRLALCYGDETGLKISVKDGLTTVAFALPLERQTQMTSVPA